MFSRKKNSTKARVWLKLKKNDQNVKFEVEVTTFKFASVTTPR
jgi:hypothetical protein